MPTSETRYQRIHRLIQEGKSGLLPLDFSCPCPRREGPLHPHADHPGKVGFLTCQGCEHQVGLHFDNRVCTHPKARHVAAKWLADAIRRWEQQQAQAAVEEPQSVAPAPSIELPHDSSCRNPPRQESPVQLSMF